MNKDREIVVEEEYVASIRNMFDGCGLRIIIDKLSGLMHRYPSFDETDKRFDPVVYIETSDSRGYARVPRGGYAYDGDPVTFFVIKRPRLENDDEYQRRIQRERMRNDVISHNHEIDPEYSEYVRLSKKFGGKNLTMNNL